jgi:hypothetical protein
MRSFSPVRLCRALSRRSGAAVVTASAEAPSRLRPIPDPTVYADAPLARVLAAIDRRASDLEAALTEYARARRAAGIQPEAVLVEFKRVLRRAVGLDIVRSASTRVDADAMRGRRLTGRLIELYFAA